jgi:hypothetical protein
MALQIDPDRGVDGPNSDLAVADLDVDRVQKHRRVDRADSTDRRESAGYEMPTPSCHQLVRRPVLQALARPVVELHGDLAQPFVADRVEVDAFGEVLPQQAVRRSYVCQAALATASAVFAGTVAA